LKAFFHEPFTEEDAKVSYSKGIKIFNIPNVVVKEYLGFNEENNSGTHPVILAGLL